MNNSKKLTLRNFYILQNGLRTSELILIKNQFVSKAFIKTNKLVVAGKFRSKRILQPTIPNNWLHEAENI